MHTTVQIKVVITDSVVLSTIGTAVRNLSINLKQLVYTSVH